MENAVYSVISPEGCASILWKDAQKTQQAAESLKLTAEDLLNLGVAERIIPENREWAETYRELREEMADLLQKNSRLPLEELLQKRYEKFRKIGAQI